MSEFTYPTSDKYAYGRGYTDAQEKYMKRVAELEAGIEVERVAGDAMCKRIAELETENAVRFAGLQKLAAQLNDCGTWAFDMCIAHGGLEEQLKDVREIPRYATEFGGYVPTGERSDPDGEFIFAADLDAVLKENSNE